LNRKIVLLFSVLLAVLAVVLMQMYKTNLAKELGVSGKRVAVLVASEKIPAFTEIESSQLQVKEYPENFLPPGHHNKAMMRDLVGQTTVFDIMAGAPILTKDMALTQRTAQLSTKILKDMRALALPVDKVNSFGGLLRPSDHVDILGTFQKPASGDVETVTLLQNVTVLAVGGQLGGNSSSSSSSRKGSRRTRANTVTVAVTPEEAELLVFAQDRGTLGLTMRGKDDVNDEPSLTGKSFADIFEPTVRKKIQQKRNTRVSSDPGITIQSGRANTRRRR
jgi:pilus assembly protein CpaB